MSLEISEKLSLKKLPNRCILTLFDCSYVFSIATLSFENKIKRCCFVFFPTIRPRPVSVLCFLETVPYRAKLYANKVVSVHFRLIEGFLLKKEKKVCFWKKKPITDKPIFFLNYFCPTSDGMSIILIPWFCLEQPCIVLSYAKNVVSVCLRLILVIFLIWYPEKKRHTVVCTIYSYSA